MPWPPPSTAPGLQPLHPADVLLTGGIDASAPGFHDMVTAATSTEPEPPGRLGLSCSTVAEPEATDRQGLLHMSPEPELGGPSAREVPESGAFCDAALQRQTSGLQHCYSAPDLACASASGSPAKGLPPWCMAALVPSQHPQQQQGGPTAAMQHVDALRGPCAAPGNLQPSSKGSPSSARRASVQGLKQLHKAEQLAPQSPLKNWTQPVQHRPQQASLARMHSLPQTAQDLQGRDPHQRTGRPLMPSGLVASLAPAEDALQGVTCGVQPDSSDDDGEDVCPGGMQAGNGQAKGSGALPSDNFQQSQQQQQQQAQRAVKKLNVFQEIPSSGVVAPFTVTQGSWVHKASIGGIKTTARKRTLATMLRQPLASGTNDSAVSPVSPDTAALTMHAGADPPFTSPDQAVQGPGSQPAVWSTPVVPVHTNEQVLSTPIDTWRPGNVFKALQGPQRSAASPFAAAAYQGASAGHDPKDRIPNCPPLNTRGQQAAGQHHRSTLFSMQHDEAEQDHRSPEAAPLMSPTDTTTQRGIDATPLAAGQVAASRDKNGLNDCNESSGAAALCRSGVRAADKENQPSKIPESQVCQAMPQQETDGPASLPSNDALRLMRGSEVANGSGTKVSHLIILPFCCTIAGQQHLYFW